MLPTPNAIWKFNQTIHGAYSKYAIFHRNIHTVCGLLWFYQILPISFRVTFTDAGTITWLPLHQWSNPAKCGQTRIHDELMISMGQCKKDVTPLLTHWSYVILALTHRYITTRNQRKKWAYLMQCPCILQSTQETKVNRLVPLFTTRD